MKSYAIKLSTTSVHYNRDLRKFRQDFGEVRSKENRESSTTKRDFHAAFFRFFFSLPLSRNDQIHVTNAG